jgi:Ni,Fe-hydrogenase III large subunit
MTLIKPEPAGARPGVLASAGRGTDQVSTVVIAPGELEAVVHELIGMSGARLADVFATGTDPVLLRLVWALDSDQRYLIIESAIYGLTYPALSDIAPAAFAEECEIYEQFGIRPAGGKPLNRVAIPPQAGPGFPRLGRAPTEPPREVHAPHVVGGEAFEFPFGPVRQVGVESLYYGLVTSGEEVVDLYLFTWHKHRGVEFRARGARPQDALFHVERVEGLGAIGNSWAFAAAVEAALGIEPSPDAMRARAIALELERLYNHAAATAALCQACGLSVGQAAAEMALERMLRLNAAVFGHRYLFGVVGMGGARRGPDALALRSELPAAYAALTQAADALLATNSFVDRLEATGTVSTEDVRRLGLVGPVARGSGVGVDVRANHPSGPYAECRPAVASRDGGDVLARFQVMLAEAAESVRLIGDFLDAGAGPGAVGAPAVTPGPGGRAAGPRSGLGWAESSRGEALAWVELDTDGRISRARLRPAAVRNWRGFDDACRSQNVFTDIPIIEASFWLTVAGTAH